MEKQQRWRLVVILAVLAWTLYSIFPTIIYYSRPLSQPVDEKGAEAIELEIAARVNRLVPEAQDWIQAFCKLLGVHPSKITVDPNDASLITFDVASPEEANLVEKFLPRAGLMVPSKPAQIYLDAVNGKSIRVNRHVSVTMDEKNLQENFFFLWKRNKEGHPTEAYIDLVVPRFIEVAYACAGTSPRSEALTEVLQRDNSELLEKIVGDVAEWRLALSSDNDVTKRLFYSLIQGPGKLEGLNSKLNSEAKRFESERTAAQKEQETAIAKGEVVSSELLDRIKRLDGRIEQYRFVAEWLGTQKFVPTEGAP